MRSNFPHIGLAKLCGWFGITRQAYYQNNWDGISTTLEEDLILQQVKNIRKHHRRMGTRKLYGIMQSFMLEHSIKMGRDGLFNLLAANHLLVRKRKRRIQTTNSHHWLRKYPNLIRDFVPTAINQLWVSDITYWRLREKHVYISFVTDVYSHKIVGYQVAETMDAIESIQALQMALSGLGPESHLNLTHHSDRGLQYCSHAYVKLLQAHNIKISMTENGDPYENAIAERVNGILKTEWLYDMNLVNYAEAKEAISSIIDIYNTERPHSSIEMLTPNEAHQMHGQLKRLWKSYRKIKLLEVEQK